MLKGYNLLGTEESSEGGQSLQAFSPVNCESLPANFTIATTNEINKAVAKAVAAFVLYKNSTAESRAIFLETIAAEIMAAGDELIQRAILETGLPEARLLGERGRTTGQLQLFANLLREGSWVEAVIDTAMPERKPLPRADLRKMQVPIGPVLVFGASNFPFAFSTAGGDTASALAAGNPVIVKAHPSHLGTNEIVGAAINRAVKKCNLPDGVFSFVIGDGIITGMQLVKHPGIHAVGFTGSYTAGISIYKAAINERETPIPVYAEMSSINPVLLLPSRLQQETDTIATQVAASVLLGAGQFCTNPGLLLLLESRATVNFIQKIKELFAAAPAATMLNPGICRAYYAGRQAMSGQKGVSVLLAAEEMSETHKAAPTLLQVSANDFIDNPKLQHEIFGPTTLLVTCKNETALLQAVECLKGQLTGTVMANKQDIESFSGTISSLAAKVGRLIYNGVPTGVEVSHAMQHGGPFPSTTDARSTSVGADASKRFVRPLCLQDCPQEFLPDALKNDNPLGIMRKVNGVFSRDAC